MKKKLACLLFSFPSEQGFGSFLKINSSAQGKLFGPWRLCQPECQFKSHICNVPFVKTQNTSFLSQQTLLDWLRFEHLQFYIFPNVKSSSLFPLPEYWPRKSWCNLCSQNKREIQGIDSWNLTWLSCHFKRLLRQILIWQHFRSVRLSEFSVSSRFQNLCSDIGIFNSLPAFLLLDAFHPAVVF